MKTDACPTCDGKIERIPKAGRVGRLHGRVLALPSTLAIPTCTMCHREYRLLDDEAAAEFEAALVAALANVEREETATAMTVVPMRLAFVRGVRSLAVEAANAGSTLSPGALVVGV